MAQSNNKQELPPGAVSALNPEAGGLFQLTPEDEAIVNDYARQRGVSQAEAVRTLLRHRNGQDQGQTTQQTVMERTLETIDKAQQLGVASQDPNDVINSMGKGLVIKNLAKGLNDDTNGNSRKATSYEDLKEMMYLRIMGGLAGINNESQGGSSSIVQEIKSENDKLRQELKDSEAKRLQEQKDSEAKRQADMEKLEAKMRDMLFEKKIEKLEEKSAAAQTSVLQEIKNLSERVDLYGRIPQTAAGPERKDAVSELEDIGEKLTRIKTALAPIFPQVSTPVAPSLLTPASPPPSLKNPDGTTDYLAAAERIGGIVVKGIEAFNKKAPEKAGTEVISPVQHTAQPQTYTERRMGLDEYADYLLSLKERTPEQQQWLINYQAHLEREQAKIKAPVAAEHPVVQAVQPYRPPGEPQVEIVDTPVETEQPETGPEFSQSQDEPIVEQPEEEQPEPEEPPAETDEDVVEKMREAEAERIKMLQGVV